MGRLTEWRRSTILLTSDKEGNMPKEVWLTILGGFLSGGAGITLFFIQRCKEKQDEQQNILFRIYQLVIAVTVIPHQIMLEAFLENRRRLKDIQALSFLVKDKELARFIWLYAGTPSQIRDEEVLGKILSRFNKKLYQETVRVRSGVDRGAGPEPEKK
jgi:hypothetical protein